MLDQDGTNAVFEELQIRLFVAVCGLNRKQGYQQREEETAALVIAAS